MKEEEGEGEITGEWISGTEGFHRNASTLAYYRWGHSAGARRGAKTKKNQKKSLLYLRRSFESGKLLVSYWTVVHLKSLCGENAVEPSSAWFGFILTYFSVTG